VEKARENLSQGKKNLSHVKEKHQSEYSIHITKTPTHTHTNTHTPQNNIKPPQYKLKQTQCKIYPNEIVTI
jgi:protein-arginine kinase activator protein McsA